MSVNWLHWGGIGAWLVMSAFMSGMEAGVMALNRLRIRQLARSGNRGARTLLHYLDSPENFLWTILVGNTLANFALVLMLAADIQHHFGDRPWVLWPLLLLIGLFLYLFADLLTKALFRKFPNRLTLRLAPAFRVVHFVLAPLVTGVEHFARLLLKLTGGSALSGHLFGNRDELRALLLESGHRLGTTERNLITRVLDLQNRTVSQVARPLDLVESVLVSTPVEEVVRRCQTSGHTRLPVWSSDRRDRRIVGVISLKNLLYRDEVPAGATAVTLLKPALFLGESVRLEVALRRLQRSGQPLAIVVDRNGRERGLVSLSDILGAVFGEVNV